MKFWFGNSRGRWEGDTLVVEVTSLNGRGWFDSTGHFYTENTRMIERWTIGRREHDRLRGDDRGPHDLYQTLEDELPEEARRDWPETEGRPHTQRGCGGVASAPPVKDPYAIEAWEVACYEGNKQVPGGIRDLGYKCFRGVTPPK